jgi:asparagine synthase (glutamine-hydrolysing)
VCIGGAGADELFSGYYDHHLFYLRQIKSDKKLFKKSLSNWKNRILKITRNPFLKNYKIFLSDKRPRNHIFLNNEIFSTFLKSGWREKFVESKFISGELRNRMLNEIFYETIPAILHEEDLNAMFYSIENRTPFLDNKLFEACSLIPTKFLINNGEAKSVLRESMKGIVLDKVLKNTKKVGFNASILELMNFKDSKVRSELLDDSKIFEFVDKGKIEKLFKMNKMTNSYSKFLFSFISAKLFMDTN